MVQLEQVRRELRDFVVNNYVFGQAAELNDDESFMEAGLIDSTGLLELVSFVEEKYGFNVEDQELVPENLDSLAALTSYVGRKLNHSAA
jgi:acyl carrier protein